MGSSKIFTGVSCTAKDQFYSEIYNFLVSHYKQTLKEVIFEKKENLKQIEVLSKSAQQKNVKKYLESQVSETSIEKAERVIKEYQTLGNLKYGEQLYKNLLESDPSNADIKYSYAIYCIKNKLKKPEEVLNFV